MTNGLWQADVKDLLDYVDFLDHLPWPISAEEMVAALKDRGFREDPPGSRVFATGFGPDAVATTQVRRSRRTGDVTSVGLALTSVSRGEDGTLAVADAFATFYRALADVMGKPGERAQGEVTMAGWARPNGAALALHSGNRVRLEYKSPALAAAERRLADDPGSV